jgi:uncharacterized GH25 family protein
MKNLIAMAGLAASVWSASVQAHEFWIDPLEFEIDAGGTIEANIRVGEEFEGAAYSYLPPNFRRFDLVIEAAVTPVEGRAGDRPALAMQARDTGLTTVVHVTRDYNLTYREWQKFLDFCNHKDFAWAIAEHEARGLPQTGFQERYSRHAKSLIAVGDAAGSDSEVGLEAEIVALANPYTDDLAEGFPVQVFYQGAPRGDVQVELFQRAPDGSVAITLHRTDAAGIAVLPVEPGHAYLADHVVMRPIGADVEEGPVWESLWASLTFAVPS